jgi:hypothetical protein
MPSNSKFYFFIFLFFSALCSIYFALRPSVALAQIPPAPVSCGSTINPEFHSLRPYQASPCQSTMGPFAKFCGNNLTLHDTIRETYNGNSEGCITTTDGKIRCSYSEQVSKPLVIDLSGANLPIMGNTEEVKNSQNSEETLDDAQKVNNYVSWYLNGVNYRAEYGSSKVDANSLVNFSGPINKLMPSIILDAQRIKSIENAGKENHNQIVVCGENSLGGFGDIFHVGTVTPKECYKGDNTDAQGSVFRLKPAGGFLGAGGEDGWSGDLSFWNDLLNNIVGKIVDLMPSIPGLPSNIDLKEAIKTSVLNHWNKRVPPLPWENDPFAKPTRQMTALEYRKYYQEWRGKTCVIIPVINWLVCFDNVLVPNKYADLFPYVPLSGTEDLKGGISIDNVSSATNPATAGVTVQNVSFLKQTPATLFFAHMQESDELATLLQTTFVASGEAQVGSPTSVDSNTSCNTVEVRTNKGDNLFAKQITGDLHYSASFSCDFEPPSIANCMSNCIAAGNYTSECASLCSSPEATKYSTQTCTKDVYISLSTTSSTPKVDDIWSRLVAGPEAIFKRIFPKLNVEGSLGQIMDIPGSTNITYSGAGISQSQTDLKLPHIGGISEYFLKGIQTMLRPKGYGEQIEFNRALSCKNATLPEIPAASQTACKLCNYPSNLPELMVKIFEAAADAYNVPASVLYATFMHEGGTHDVWDDASALEWSVCGGEVPNCDRTSSTSQPPYGWFPVYFYNGYWDAVKVIDPGRTKEETSPCNFLDATFATAKALSDSAGGRPASARFPLSQDPSQTFSRVPDVCLDFDLNNDTGRPGSCSAWNTNTVATAEIGYSGWCPEPGKHPIQPYFPDIADWLYQTVDYYQKYTCK